MLKRFQWYRDLPEVSRDKLQTHVLGTTNAAIAAAFAYVWCLVLVWHSPRHSMTLLLTRGCHSVWNSLYKVLACAGSDTWGNRQVLACMAG